MIDIEAIRADWQAVATNLERRGVDGHQVEQLFEADQRWRELAARVDQTRQAQKEANDTIAQAADDTRAELLSAAKQAAGELKELEQKLTALASQRTELWQSLPNVLADDVPEGGEDAFELVRAVPEAEPPAGEQSYLDLVTKDIDLERAAQVSGSRFVYLKGQLARLQMGLVSFAFDTLAVHGFTPVIPPVLVNEQAMAGMGYLDTHADEVYKVQDDLYLTGTSEQSIGAMHMNELLPADQLPLRYVGYSTCFRREAGSHGKDVKGILRMHQFDKVEMFSFTTPDQSANEHAFLLARQEELMAALELPYRVIKLASQDLGRPSAKTYDIETWMPSEGRYRETHSTSNTTDYQARRLNIRYKNAEGTHKVHMLNGTAFAIGRILIALIENHAQPDGSIAIPEALHSYLPFTKIEA